jgi:hypothetical protein
MYNQGGNKSYNIKELPGINNKNRSSSNNRNVEEGQDRGKSDLENSYQYKKRNASGNHRNIIPISNSLN